MVIDDEREAAEADARLVADALQSTRRTETQIQVLETRLASARTRARLLQNQLASARTRARLLQNQAPKANGATHPEIAQLQVLRDRIAVLEMKNTLISDVLRAADAASHAYPPAELIATPLARAFVAWRAAGKPGLIEEEG